MDTQRQWTKDLKARLREWWQGKTEPFVSAAAQVWRNLPGAVFFGALAWLVAWCVAWCRRTYTEILLPGSFDYSGPGGHDKWQSMQVRAIVFGVIAGLAFLVAMSDKSQSVKSQSVKKRTGIQTRRSRRSHRAHRLK